MLAEVLAGGAFLDGSLMTEPASAVSSVMVEVSSKVSSPQSSHR